LTEGNISNVLTASQGPETVEIKAYDLLVSTNRNTDGRGYEQLKNALDRLSGTRIRTNIKTGEQEITEGFGLIDGWRVVRQTASGRMTELRITLSDWVFNAVVGREVLTLHRDYFRLRKPLERRIYELARKHCGKQDEWVISLEMLKKKCGSTSEDYEFRRLLNIICAEDQAHNHMPDYAVSFDGEKVRFSNRSTMKPLPSPQQLPQYPRLDPETYHDARTVAPGYDVHYLEQEWQNFWFESGQPELSNPNAAFIGFCRSRYQRKPNP
jgi:plasmid replication initiation protein